MTSDGGPAFPTQGSVMEWSDLREQDVEKPVTFAGLSIRDYFAAQALPQAIAHALEMRGNMIRPGLFDFYGVARAAYVMADAMLKEREKQSS